MLFRSPGPLDARVLAPVAWRRAIRLSRLEFDPVKWATSPYRLCLFGVDKPIARTLNPWPGRSNSAILGTGDQIRHMEGILTQLVIKVT